MPDREADVYVGPAPPGQRAPVGATTGGRSTVSFRGDREAFGKPGIEPRWTWGGKEGVGTAYSSDSRVWFTLWRGILTEVYYPTVDRPQIRDLQFLTTDGSTFFHEEKRHLVSEAGRLTHHALGYRAVNRDPDGRYAIHKETIASPHLPCVLQHVRLTGDAAFLARLRLYALCAPHLGVGGSGNRAYVLDAGGRMVLAAQKGGQWLALGATVPFSRLSCGFVGRSDGWTDLHEHLTLEWEFDRATDGNVALTGELDRGGARAFTLGLAFGESVHSAVDALFDSLAVPFRDQRTRFVAQWNRACRGIRPLGRTTRREHNLYHGSVSVLLAHEDKTYPGALIASLSIPWGEAKGDQDTGGYHLVWTRDLVNSATALIAAGDTKTAQRALVYLAVNQRADGGFPQNFWIDGTPYWQGIQLDEVAFPILLAWRLRTLGSLGEFDPYAMVLRAAGYLVRHGPVTQQERWEEASGYSPSTLASNIAALICAAQFARGRGDAPTASYLEDYADFLESHVEDWTVTTQGDLVPGIPRHFIRICPASVDDPHPDEDPNRGTLRLANQPPGVPANVPAKRVVDGGFLELVRYGIRAADDPVVRDSVRVVDAVLKVETPLGPCWHRYNHDGYGQQEDGGPYVGWGKGRAWPLLTGERGHYEIAAGRDPTPYLAAMERFASPTGLLPEQVWDEADRPDLHMFAGRPTGSAMPLAWAHAEYVKLLRSAADRAVFDRIPAVADRFLRPRRGRRRLEVWKPNRQARSVAAGSVLRIQAEEPFRLHWSSDGWKTVSDTESTATTLGAHFADLPAAEDGAGPYRFTFYWIARDAWEGRDFAVAVGAATGPR